MPDSNFSREEQKQIYKEAYKEWLSEEKARLQQNIGKWVINSFLAALVAGLGYFTLNASGWHK